MLSLKDEVIRVSTRTFVDEIIDYGSQFFSKVNLEALRACTQWETTLEAVPQAGELLGDQE